MIALVTRRILSALKIQADEVQQVLLVCVFALLPSVGGAIGSPGIEALFFARFGVQFLPYMYIALGAITMVLTLTLTAALSRIPKSRLFRLIPITMMLLLLTARILVGMDLAGFYPVLWLGMYVFWTLQALFIWGAAGMSFDMRQAKRLFPHIAASAILGNALGGLATQPLVSWLGTENLLLVWALMLGVTFILALRLTHAFDPPDIHFHRPKPGIRETLVGGGETVTDSSLLRWHSLGTLLVAVLLFALAFPFSKAVAAQFPDEDALAGFLGVFQGLTTGAALLISITITNRLFARVGFVGALLIFTLIYVAGFSSLAFVSSFTILVVFRFLQQAWMMGVADTAHQAIFNTVPPEKREPARMFIDGVPRQVGVALSGIMMLTIHPMLSEGIRFAMYAFIAFAATLALWRARSAFANSLADALDSSQLHIFDSAMGMTELARDPRAYEVLTAGLESEDDSIRQTAVEILAGIDSAAAERALLQSLQDPVAPIRTIVLHALLDRADEDLKREVLLSALSDPSARVRGAALRALPEDFANLPSVHERLRSMLDDRSLEVRALASAHLIRDGHDRQARTVLSAMARSDEIEARRHAMIAFETWGSREAYELAVVGLSDPDQAVRSTALRAVTAIDPAGSIELIRAALGDRHQGVRLSAARSAAVIGSDAVPAVLESLGDPRLQQGALLALEALPIDPEAPALVEFVHAKIQQALELDGMRKRLFPDEMEHPRLRLLARSLQNASRGSAFRAIQAFRLMSDRKSVALAMNAIQSHSIEERANALELLDALDEQNLITAGLSLWEPGSMLTVPPDHDRARALRIQTISHLLENDDAWLRACAAFAAPTQSDCKLQEQLLELSRTDPDPLVRETALQGAKMKESSQSISTLPIMERILFLRKVPLFAELSAEELKQVASIAGEHVFLSGEEFVREGELGDEMYIIVTGNVRVVKRSKGKQEIAERGPGEFVGEMSILTREPRMASLVADSDVFALCLEQTNFEQMLLEKPEIGLSVMRALIQRLKDSRELSL